MHVQANWENQLLALAGNVQHAHKRPFFSYWAGDASLRKAYREAEKITSEHSKSFHFASGLLPEEKRSAPRPFFIRASSMISKNTITTSLPAARICRWSER